MRDIDVTYITLCHHRAMAVCVSKLPPKQKIQVGVEEKPMANDRLRVSDYDGSPRCNRQEVSFFRFGLTVVSMNRKYFGPFKKNHSNEQEFGCSCGTEFGLCCES